MPLKKEHKKTSYEAFYQPYNSLFVVVCVRLTGIEPALREKLDPKSSASANSATGAFAVAKVSIKNETTAVQKPQKRFLKAEKKRFLIGRKVMRKP